MQQEIVIDIFLMTVGPVTWTGKFIIFRANKSEPFDVDENLKHQKNREGTNKVAHYLLKDRLTR